MGSRSLWIVGFALAAVSVGCGQNPLSAGDIVTKENASVVADAAAAPPERCDLSLAPTAPLERIPHGVMILAHVDARAYLSSPLGQGAGPQRGQNELVDAMLACGLPPARVQGLDFGLYSPTETILVVQAPGIGETATLECLQGRLSGSGSEPSNEGWSFEEGACPPMLRTHSGDLRAFQAAEDSLVVVTGEWHRKVAARLRGEGISAVEGELERVLAAVDPSGVLWLVAAVPDTMVPALVHSPFAGIERLSVAAHGSAGMNLNAKIDFRRTQEAAVWEATARAALGRLIPQLTAGGPPESLASLLVLTRTNKKIELTLGFSEGQVAALAALTAPENVSQLYTFLYGAGDRHAKPAPAPAPVPPARTGSPKGDIYVHACVGGDAASCYMLANMYARGVEIVADGTQAVALYERACGLGHDEACGLLDRG